MNNNIGTKVTVSFRHYPQVKRVLHEDSLGLYIRCRGQRVPVWPETNCLGEVVRGYYVGNYPKARLNEEGTKEKARMKAD